MKLSPRTKLFGIFVLFGLPIVASYLSYYVWKPAGSRVHGELLAATPLNYVSLTTLDGMPAGLDQLRGKWVLLQVESGQCDAACANRLYYGRQVRTAQGRHMERVARAVVIDDDAMISGELRRANDGALFLRADAALLRQLPASGAPRGCTYVIDPLGNLVLRYPSSADPQGMIHDLQRLLSVSQIG